MANFHSVRTKKAKTLSIFAFALFALFASLDPLPYLLYSRKCPDISRQIDKVMEKTEHAEIANYHLNVPRVPFFPDVPLSYFNACSIA
jgi:hypothetical protein